MADPLYDNPRSPKSKDPLDFTDKFNTKLSDEEEKKFKEWMGRQSEAHGRDLSGDLYDYDMRGLFKSLKGEDVPKGHGPDTHKKPNHPTFSDESEYHGRDGYEGGSWSEKDGKHRFKPGKTNKKLRSADERRQYFDEVEPGVELLED